MHCQNYYFFKPVWFLEKLEKKLVLSSHENSLKRLINDQVDVFANECMHGF